MKKIVLLMLLGLMAPMAFAITLPTDLAGAALDASLATVMGNLETVAMKVLFSLSMLQFIITGVGLYQAGEIDVTIGKFAKFITWTGFCLWLLAPSGNADGLSNSGHFIKSSVDGFIALAGSWTATQGSSFNTSDIMMTGLVAYGNITLSVAKVTATNAVNAAMALFVPGVALLTLIMTFTVSVIVLVSCAYIALKVFMVKLELGLVLAMAPLSISMLGLQGLREQGFAPFKSMLALIYRTVVLGATVSAIGTVSKFLSDYVNGQAYGIAADVWGPLIAAAFGYVILAFVAHKSDSIASSLANGSAGLGSGDVASAAAIGAAVGAAVMTGGASVAAGAAKMPQSMGNFMQGLRGGASVSNGSTQGMGGASSSLPLSPPHVSSLGSEGGKGGNPTSDVTAPTEPLKPTPDQLSKLSPQAQNGYGVSAAAEAAGANPAASKAAGDTAYMGGSPQEIEAATRSAGGTQAQGQAAGAASTGVGGPDWNKAAKPVDSGPSSGSTAAIGAADSTNSTKQGSGNQKGFLDHLSNVGHHMSQEKAATHVSVNTHHSD